MAPMEFARAGALYYDVGGLGVQSANGHYWSRRILSSTVSCYLSLGSDKVRPQYYLNYGYGFSLRCLAR